MGNRVQKQHSTTKHIFKMSFLFGSKKSKKSTRNSSSTKDSELFGQPVPNMQQQAPTMQQQVPRIQRRQQNSFFANNPFSNSNRTLQSKPEIKNLSKTDKIPRIIIVLDETGSMQSSKPVTISSYNEWLDSNRTKDENEDFFPRFTLVRFNSGLPELEEHESVETAPRLTNENYNPTNMTALYDAIGKSINSYKDEKDNIMVILTDGEENSSRFFQQSEVKKLLETYSEEYGWIFHYLGASSDSWSVGQQIGIRDPKFCTSYVADDDGFDHAWAENAVQMKAYRGYQAKKSKGISVGSMMSMSVPKLDKSSYLASKSKKF